MKKDFLQPKIEFIFLNDNIILLVSRDVDNVVGFPEKPTTEEMNVDLS